MNSNEPFGVDTPGLWNRIARAIFKQRPIVNTDN